MNALLLAPLYVTCLGIYQHEVAPLQPIGLLGIALCHFSLPHNGPH